MSRFILCGLLGLASIGLLSAARPVIPLVIKGDGVVNATVGGVPATLRLTPWAPAAPTLNPDLAQRIGLKGGLFGFVVKVGPVKVSGQSSVTKFAFGQMMFRRRVVWFERRYEAATDGAIGPGGLPADVIRYELRAPVAGERVAVLPLVQQLFRPTYGRVDVGGRALTILFDPQHSRTLATAGAGASIAAAQGGQLSGAAGMAEVAFGINRPVRRLQLARPLAIGPLSIGALLVRVGDNGSVAGIADANADPDEIVVTATRKGDRRDVLIIGRDELAGCSSITFDKPAKQIRLSCA